MSAGEGPFESIYPSSFILLPGEDGLMDNREDGSLAAAPEISAAAVLEHPDPNWAFAIGNWGDTLAAIGTTEAVLRRSGRERIGMLHFGPDPAISRFLAAQPWCTEARWIKPDSHQHYCQVVALACDPRVPAERWMPELFQPHGIDWRTVAATQLQWRAYDPEIFTRPHGLELAPEARQRAAELRASLGSARDRVYLLHPRSTDSCTWQGHWFYRRLASSLEYLLESTPHTYVLTGRGWSCPIRHPRLVDLVGRQDSMMDVLALAERCDGMITTSNSLSMWSVTQEIPAVVCQNHGYGDPNSLFWRWTAQYPNMIVRYHDDLNAFRVRCRDLFVQTRG
jgi:hypothetical protein